MTSPAAAQLSACPLFREMDAEVLASLAPAFDVEIHAAGHRVVAEGDSGYAFYVVAEGSLVVSRTGVEAGRLGPGDFFGEIAFDGHAAGRRSATVTAATPSVLWVMFGTRFRALQLAHPDVAASIRATMESRLQAGGTTS